MSPNWSASWLPPDPLGADPVLIAGIAAYRRHPWSRDLPDPPVAWREGGSRLLDYGLGSGGPAVLFVPSLVNGPHILDLTERRSLLRFLARAGARPLLMDWGWPGELERSFSLTDYIAGRLERAIATIPGPIVLVGYCMGGLLALAAAQRLTASDPARLSGCALLATPWDFHADGPRLPAAATAASRALEPMMRLGQTLPVDTIQTLFALAEGVDSDTGVAARYRGFAALDPDSERARVFVALEDWLNDGVPLPASVARECLGGWYGGNTPAQGAWLVAGLPVRPASVPCPMLVVVPGRDRIVPPASARALAAAAPTARVVDIAAGHIGMVAGGGAETGLWAALLAWLRAL